MGSRAARPLFSIGAVARILGLSPATIRTWETRYGQVVPQRSEGGQRLYSREQVEQLRFIQAELNAGRRPGEAHRLLSERIAVGRGFARRTRVLIAEPRAGALEGLRELLGAEAFELSFAGDPESARAAIDRHDPVLVVIDTNDPAFDALAAELRGSGVKVLPIGLLERSMALLDEARKQPQP